MSLRLIPHRDIDRTRWNEAIYSAYNSSVYGMSWYLDACAPGWAALVKGDYEQMMAIPLKYKMGVSYAYQALFVQQAGIFSKVAIQTEDIQEFLRFLDTNIAKVKLYLTPECNLSLWSAQQVESRRSQFIPLDRSIEEIRNSYSDNAKRNIRKAEKNGLNLQFSIDYEVVIKGFKNQSGEHVKQIGDAGFQKLYMLLDQLQQHTDSHVAQVYTKEGQLLYSAFFTGFNGAALYVKGFGTDLSRNTGAGHFLMDRMIKKYLDDGYKLFDFGGSNAETVRKFNMQFGSEEFEYFCYNGGYLPAFLRNI